MASTLRDLGVLYAVEGAPSMENLVKKSGILATAPVIPSSHGTFHKYKILDELPTGSIRTIGGGVTAQVTKKTPIQLDLKEIYAVLEDDATIVEETGVEAYFREEMDPFTEGMGQTVAKLLIYGNDPTFGAADGPQGLHQLAKASGNVIQQGGATGSRTTIFVVKYRPGRNGCGVVVNSKVIETGEIVKASLVNKGDKIVENVSGVQYPKYKMDFQSYFAFLSGSNFDVAAYTQLEDADTDRPTAGNMDASIDSVKGTAADTFIYCSRTGKRLLGQLKNSKLQLGNMDNDYKTRLDFWDGIPVVVDDNIRNDETTVLD